MARVIGQQKDSGIVDMVRFCLFRNFYVSPQLFDSLKKKTVHNSLIMLSGRN